MARDKNKERNVSDTPTDAPEPTEPSTGTEGTESTTEAEPAAPKPSTEELVATLQAQVDNALQTASGDALAEGVTETLQAAYRAVPAAKRGQVQAQILRDKISEPGANHQAIATILEVMTQAPATKTRAPKAPRPETPEFELVAQAINALDVARQELVNSISTDEIRTQALDLATSRFDGTAETSTELTEAINAAAAKAVKAVTVKARKASGGTGGPRFVKTEGLTELLSDGRLTAGAELKHGENVATVTADGKLTVGGVECANPTAAAKQAGVTSSVNGWDYWQFDGKPVGNLRTK